MPVLTDQPELTPIDGNKRPMGKVAAFAASPVRIAIDGPLRVGKSTLARLLAERTGAYLFSESEDNPFLGRFYAGDSGMAFAAQMWFLRQRLSQLGMAAKRKGLVVVDYTLEKDQIFAHLNLSDAELSVYKETLRAATEPVFRPDLTVYLQASPAVLRERRRRRGLPEERRIGTEYMEQVCAAYEHFYARFPGGKLLVVDTSAIDFVENACERNLLLDRILGPVYGREYFAPLARIA